jgi:CheY-like chemotaxis protein
MQLNLLLGTALLISLILLVWREILLRRLRRQLKEREQNCKADEVAANLQNPLQPVTFGGLHILMAGNRGDAQFELSLLLTRLGAAVDHVENGWLAIQAILHGAITHDVILLEEHMPEMDALKTTAELRDVLQLLDLPVYGLQFGQEVDVAFATLAQQTGMNGVFQLPAEMRKLFDALLNSPRQLPLF